MSLKGKKRSFEGDPKRSESHKEQLLQRDLKKSFGIHPQKSEEFLASRWLTVFANASQASR